MAVSDRGRSRESNDARQRAQVRLLYLGIILISLWKNIFKTQIEFIQGLCFQIKSDFRLFTASILKITFEISYLDYISQVFMIYSDFQKKCLYCFRLFFIESDLHPWLYMIHALFKKNKKNVNNFRGFIFLIS